MGSCSVPCAGVQINRLRKSWCSGLALYLYQVAVSQYVGVVTIVLVKKALKDDVTQIETSERGIGLLGFGVSAGCVHKVMWLIIRETKRSVTVSIAVSACIVLITGRQYQDENT